MTGSPWNDTACTRCTLAECRKQVVVATPCQPGELLAIGEAPGGDEDVKGEGFVGSAGKTLDRLLAVHGIARDDYGRANVCRCRPPKNRKPTKDEIRACVPYLADLIIERRPRVILAVGATATAVLCGPGSLYTRITERRAIDTWGAGLTRDLAHEGIRAALDHAAFVVPMPHSSSLAFNRNAPSGEKWGKIAVEQVAIVAGLLK